MRYTFGLFMRWTKHTMARKAERNEEEETLWFLESKVSLSITIVVILTCLALNCVMFFHYYSYYARMYQVLIALSCAFSCCTIFYYWTCPRGPKLAEPSIRYISNPLMGMTLVMAAGSILGYLTIFYFTTVFWDCDEAIGSDEHWEIVSDVMFYLILTLTFALYPVFVFRGYFTPIAFKFKWILHIVAVNIVVRIRLCIF